MDVFRFYGPRDVTDRYVQGLNRLEGTDIFYRNKILKKFFFDLEIKTDQYRFWLPFGLLIINIEENFVTDFFLP